MCFFLQGCYAAEQVIWSLKRLCFCMNTFTHYPYGPNVSLTHTFNAKPAAKRKINADAQCCDLLHLNDKAGRREIIQESFYLYFFHTRKKNCNPEKIRKSHYPSGSRRIWVKWQCSQESWGILKDNSVTLKADKSRFENRRLKSSEKPPPVGRILLCGSVITPWTHFSRNKSRVSREILIKYVFGPKK